MPTSATFHHRRPAHLHVSRDSEMGRRLSSLRSMPPAIRELAGTPPDQFSATGSTGATPSTTGTPWSPRASPGGESRIRAALDMYGVIRLDHFRGFEAYWEVPFSSPDSSYGSWTQGPGLKFFKTLKETRHAAHHRRGPGLPHPRRHRHARQLRFPRHEDPAVCL